jgi:protein ImuB
MFACVHANSGNLFRLASSFSPVVEHTTIDTVIFSINGLERLIGTAHEIASEISRQGAALHIMQGGLAIAHNPDTAFLIATNVRGATIIPPGHEADFLCDLPVSAFPTNQEILETLERWGIETLGGLAALPEIGLAERFGEEGVRLRRLALGQTQRPLRVFSPEKQFVKRLELEYPIDLIERLLFVISSILHDLAGSLRHHGLATNRLKVVLELENGSRYERVQEFPAPFHEPLVLLKMVQVDLEAHPPKSAIVAVRIALNPVPPQTLQHGLFAPSYPAPQKLQLGLTRIAGLVGKSNVGSPSLLNTHRPDAFVVNPFSPPKTTIEPEVSAVSFKTAFRIFRPALSAVVELKKDKPAHVAASGIRGAVSTSSGPWRSSGEWWTDTYWARDEWDVELNTGGTYRIYFKLDTRNWLIEGVYD